MSFFLFWEKWSWVLNTWVGYQRAGVTGYGIQRGLDSDTLGVTAGVGWDIEEIGSELMKVVAVSILDVYSEVEEMLMSTSIDDKDWLESKGKTLPVTSFKWSMCWFQQWPSEISMSGPSGYKILSNTQSAPVRKFLAITSWPMLKSIRWATWPCCSFCWNCCQLTPCSISGLIKSHRVHRFHSMSSSCGEVPVIVWEVVL